MVFFKNIYIFHNIEVMIKKEPFWFCLGATFGVYCGTSVFNLSLSFDKITLWSYLNLVLIAFLFGWIYKDVGKLFTKRKRRTVP